ncbi:uncharacterized protein LOC106403486 [Brassica napus]|uniref:uncharacterized protein LOC106403486 n=1 Tax=Brassica napus TaxID=3708 RepID=UPI0006AA700A|nr:uncharacterized protein LOC106403486 [Brassica napus]
MPRQQDEAIGRVVYISPTAGDSYFLRILLNIVRGPRGYDEVINPLKLSDHTWRLLAADIFYIKRKEFRFLELDLQDEQLKQYTLLEVEKHVKEHNQSLADYDNMPQPDKSILSEIDNPDLRQELIYDVRKEAETHRQLFGALNQDQRNVYDAVLKFVEDQSGQLIFVYGAGGTGGRTAHSRFKFPLNLDDRSMSEIHKGSSLAALISKVNLIIWDEAPMAHRHAFETLDRSLRDLLSHDNPSAATQPFGGKTVLLGGDFRQILSVIPHGKRPDMVLASISKYYLWKMARVFSLFINMRLRQEDKDFAKWILEVGDGEADTSETSHEALGDASYPNFLQNYRSKEYLKERVVLTPTNNIVHEVNAYLLTKVPSQAREYLSSGSIELEATPDDDWTNHYPQKYLNSLEFPSMPNHILCLKVGAPVMMLRNLNKDQGLCNGTRMMVKRLGNRVVAAEIMAGTDVGEQVLIPRIQLSPTDTIHPSSFVDTNSQSDCATP